MKFTFSWLKDHLDTTASLDKICDTLTMIGLEVESVTDLAAQLKPFTVAKILQAEKHPKADKLQVCKVQSDVGELQIVCGAANARAGLYVALAKEGAVIPGSGMVIKKTKIRDVESNGMLCSADELALGTDSEGIIELPEAKIGESIVKVLGLDDPVIEIAITPNRADALGVRGVARDLAAAGLGTLKPLPSINVALKGASPISVSIKDTEKCPQFIGCYIKGVKNGASPDWLRKRLEAIGQKSISALVDITNYMTIDLARPLHVFDAKKIKGNITARDAKPGEKLKALNGKEYVLPAGATVIADDIAALGLGGIIGGEATGCTEATTEVFLEVALFDPAHIAQTGRALQIESDARYRFERGVDVDFVETGALLAIRLIKEICGGEASGLVIGGKTPQWQRSFTLPAGLVSSLGGITLPAATVEKIFKDLGFACSKAAEGWEVSPPSWRADIEGDADLVEEILRIHGYDHIPATPLPKLPGIKKSALNLSQKRAHLARRVLASRGYLEATTWSFIPEAHAKQFGGNNPKLKLLNPISADLDTMRPSLLPNLLDAAKKNISRHIWNLSLFEVGLQFSDITLTGQRMVAAGIRIGVIEFLKFHTIKADTFERTSRPVNPYDSQVDALIILETLGVNLKNIIITTEVPTWYHPGRSGALTLGGKIILGYFGQLHPAIVQKLVDKDYNLFPTIGFELFLDAIPQTRGKNKALQLSDFPAVKRDFAFIVDEKITAAEIIRALAQADKQLITDVSLFDVYTGKGVDAGKKSIAVNVTLQAMDRTLSEQEIATVSQAIIAAAKSFGGQLRQ